MQIDQDTLERLLAELNPRQREAVCHGDDPLLIVAGAGTGKTTTLAHRVAYLMASGVDASRMLLLTFTRRAAGEMLRRVDGILESFAQSETGRAASLSSRQIWGGTFHAIASRALRKYGRKIGLDDNFTIFDRADAEDLMNLVRGELDLSNSETRFPMKGTCLDIYSRCMNTQSKLETIVENHFPWCFEHVEMLNLLFQKYVDAKEKQSVLDYDDLLIFWNALLADPEGGRKLRDQFDCVLVDEYQDTNLLQAEIVRHLCPEGRGLTVVGDDAQSIYSFRAATVRNILDFPDQFPGTQVVALEQNYRSTQPILDMTNRVIEQAAERHHKHLWSDKKHGEKPRIVVCRDEDEQTDFLVDTILRQRENNIELSQQAVLFRASHHSLGLEVELSRRNIPYHKYGGLKFIEAAHVKDLLAFLRLAENPLDTVAGMRILRLLPGIGDKRAAALMSMLQESGGNMHAWSDINVPAKARDHWPLLVALMRGLVAAEEKATGLPAQVHMVRRFYTPLLEIKYDHWQNRLRDIEQMEIVAARFRDRQTFLTEITLDPPSSTQDLAGDPHLDEDYLVLSTIHSAKGLEWNSVYVIHAADGNIPSDMATGSADEIEEERRLFYVALTRARHDLYVCHPQRAYFQGRFRGDAHSFTQLTRFATNDVKACCETLVARDKADDETELSAQEIRSRMKSMWS